MTSPWNIPVRFYPKPQARYSREAREASKGGVVWVVDRSAGSKSLHVAKCARSSVA